MKPYLFFLLERRKRQRAFIAAIWERVQASERATLYRLTHGLTITDEPVAFKGGAIHRSGRGFTYTANGQATVFKGRTVAGARDNLIAWLTGEREQEAA